MSTPAPPSPVQRAVELARQGKKRQARDLLMALVEENPRQASAWWVLSQLISDEEEQAIALANVLALNPSHQRARQRLVRLQYRRGVRACRAGHKEAGAEYLGEALHYEPDHEQAWLWLSQTTAVVQERLRAIRHALRLNPADRNAHHMERTLMQLLTNPDQLALYYEQRGLFAQATAVYEEALQQATATHQRQKWQARLDELAWRTGERTRPFTFRPLWLWLRLAFGPVLLYLLLMMFHAGFLPWRLSTAVLAGLPVVWLGAMLMVGVRTLPDHWLWLRWLGVYGLRPRWRWPLWGVGLVLIVLPYAWLWFEAYWRWQGG